MSRTRVHSSLMASTAVAVLALLAASAVLAAPAPEDKEAVAAAAAGAGTPAEALLYDVDSNAATTHHKGERKKKQTTTICVQVTPGRPGHAPAVLCGDRDEVDEQQRRMQQQRVLQAPSVQVQPQAGYFGSPHVVQIVPAADTNAVTIEAAGQGRGEPLVALPSAAPSFTVVTGNAPYFRAAEGGPQAPRASEQPAEQPQQPATPAAPAAAAAAPQGHSLSDVFAASAPPLPAAEAAADHANKPQARSYGDEEIIVTKPAYGGYGPHGHQQQITVVSEGPSMYGGSQVDIIRDGPRPGGFHGGYPGSGGYPVPGGFEDQGGYHQGGFGQPPMMDNFRAAEVAAAERPAQQQQAAPAPAAGSQQARTALLLQQPVVVRKDVVIPAAGESTLSVGGPAVRVLPVNAVPVVAGLPPQWPQVAVRQQAAGQASIPITLNCDLSTLQYRGSPAEQLQLSLGRPGPVGNARAAEQAAAAADDATLKQTLGAAMDAAVSNSTVTVNLNGGTAQAGDLAKLQQELATLQQREKMLYETIQSLKAAGQQDHGAAIVGLQAAAEQITKARAAVEQAILQPGAMAGEPAQAPAPSPKAADGDALGNMQSMTAAGLQERMRSAGQFRYVSEPGLGLGMGLGFNNGPSSSVVVGMSPGLRGPPGMYPVHQQTTTTVVKTTGGSPGTGHYPFQPNYRAAQPAPQQQPQQQQQQQQFQQQQQLQQPAQPAQQREAEQPLLQPAVAGSPATQQKLLQQLREAQEDMLRMRAATLPREEARQASGDADEFPPTPGYQLLPKAADTTPATPTFSLNASAGPFGLAATGPSFVSAPTSPTQTHARQAYWGR